MDLNKEFQVDAVEIVENSELVPQSTKMEVMPKKVVLYKAFTEAQLKVKGLVTTKLLYEHGLIFGFQSIDNVSGRGQSQASKEAKEVMAHDLAKKISS
uniref:Uncharacterized protein n=1 Tax=Cannabis sativa TaxID=3483 RepID=A0A803NJ44_CANSA